MAPSSKTVILVADDEDAMVLMLRDALRGADYEVVVAHDGEQAIDQLRSNPPDLVLLDVKMPKMSGYDAYQEMKKIEPSVPSLFVTGYNMTDAANGLNGENGIEAIQKPYSAAGLSRKIKEIIARKSFLAA